MERYGFFRALRAPHQAVRILGNADTRVVLRRSGQSPELLEALAIVALTHVAEGLHADPMRPRLGPGATHGGIGWAFSLCLTTPGAKLLVEIH